ncbi:MAG: hypothetical protein JWM91_2054 [Rhodospirillales bacterium]|nr:hypothetical protein [Rhodospirillales bacterium]
MASGTEGANDGMEGYRIVWAVRSESRIGALSVATGAAEDDLSCAQPMPADSAGDPFGVKASGLTVPGTAGVINLELAVPGADCAKDGMVPRIAIVAVIINSVFMVLLLTSQAR